MQLPPQSVLESWPPGNFEHPAQTRGPGILIMVAIFLPIMIGVIIARSYSRIYIVKSFGADDAFILAALFPALGLAFVAIFSTTKLGWRMHAWDLMSRPDLISFGQGLVLATYILFSLTAAFTKISMLLFTRRIVGYVMPRLRIATDIALAVVFIENIVFIITVVFTCRPIPDYWRLSFEPQNCLNEAAHVIVASCINTATDFLVVMLSIPLALNLNVPPKQKLILILLFGSGFVVCIAGVLRIRYTYLFMIGWDRTWMGYPIWLASLIELYLGLIVASLPGARPLISYWVPSLFESIIERKNSHPDIYSPSISLSDSENNRFPHVDEQSYVVDREAMATLPRPKLAPKQPSFYTMKYGSTTSDSEIRSTCS